MANGSHPKKADGSYCAPGRVPQSVVEQEAKEKGTTYQGNEEDCEKLKRIEEKQKEKTEEQWMPVQGAFPCLVYQTQHKMDTFYDPNNSNSDCPEDMRYKDEKKETIENYGWRHPFKQREPVFSPLGGYYIQTDEDQFSLPVEEHFSRMRGLATYFSWEGKTKNIFSKMVDKFERNEGGYYMHPLLDDALREHHTTIRFNAALKRCLSENIKEGALDKDIVNLSSAYMKTKGKGAPLPQFDGDFDGTVLTVHGIWAMRVYAEKLEYKGNQIRGVFKYEVQDHFGLNADDINHPDFLEEDESGKQTFLRRMVKGATNKFESLDNFRSWYLLQHYVGYGYKPFITKINFKIKEIS